MAILTLPQKASEKLTAILKPLKDELDRVYFQVLESFPNIDGKDAGSWFISFGETWLRILQKMGQDPQKNLLDIIDLWELTLTFQGKGLATDEGRYPGIGTAVLAILAQEPRSFGTNPKAFLGSLINLLTKIPTQNGRQFFSKSNIQGSIQDLEFEQIRSFWLIAAWQAGLAPWRTAALEAVENLPATQKNLFLGSIPIEQWKADPWTGYQGAQIWATGDFIGFGGFFTEPPYWVAIESQPFLMSGGKVLELQADAYSLTLIPRKDLEGQSCQNTGVPKTLTPKLEEVILQQGFQREFLSSMVYLQNAVSFTTSFHHKVFVIPQGRIN